MRSVNTFNEEYEYRCFCEGLAQSKKPQSVVFNVIFYGFFLFLVLFAFFVNANEQGGKKIGPLAYNIVLTGSMESVYPAGTLIVSWQLQPRQLLNVGLQNGDDIVYIRENKTVVVHRIVEIIEDYEQSGQRAFKTQGVENPSPDAWLTYEGNVIGKVIWSAPGLGSTLSFISENVALLAGGAVLLLLTIALWRKVFAS